MWGRGRQRGHPDWHGASLFALHSPTPPCGHPGWHGASLFALHSPTPPCGHPFQGKGKRATAWQAPAMPQEKNK
ncbi:MAG: hypothetical protein J6T86_07335 [Bacteroidales bacterium]|nr:hypothetical protein [Bacteroidales bacterium]